MNETKTVVGTALPESNSKPEYRVTGAVCRVSRFLPAQKAGQSPLITLRLAHPEIPGQSIWVDLYLNGFSNDEAIAALPVGTTLKANLEINEPVELTDANKVPLHTQTGEPVVARRCKLTGKVEIIERPLNLKTLIAVPQVAPLQKTGTDNV